MDCRSSNAATAFRPWRCQAGLERTDRHSYILQRGHSLSTVDDRTLSCPPSSASYSVVNSPRSPTRLQGRACCHECLSQPRRQEVKGVFPQQGTVDPPHHAPTPLAPSVTAMHIQQLTDQTV